MKIEIEKIVEEEADILCAIFPSSQRKYYVGAVKDSIRTAINKALKLRSKDDERAMNIVHRVAEKLETKKPLPVRGIEIGGPNDYAYGM